MVVNVSNRTEGNTDNHKQNITTQKLIDWRRIFSPSNQSLYWFFIKLKGEKIAT